MTAGRRGYFPAHDCRIGEGVEADRPGLAYVVRAVGRKIAKAHRAKQTPHGKQTVKKLMAHGTSTNSLELSGDTKLFDRVARKWNVDYAFYQTEPGEYLLFFKSGQRTL